MGAHKFLFRLEPRLDLLPVGIKGSDYLIARPLDRERINDSGPLIPSIASGSTTPAP
jgi:hypothetical protein